MSETIVNKGKGKQVQRKPGKSREAPGRKIIPKQDEGGIGVSKVKAALRQTRRLLAKDNLSASVRQEAERKLLALEDELNGKEQKAKERKNAQKYHKVRFFERQKLVRRINKLKKAQEAGDIEVGEELYESRLLLNYVLHYPMSQKYVALFPNENDSKGKAKDSVDEKVKARIKTAMDKGDISTEPEVELEVRSTEGGTKATKRKLEPGLTEDVTKVNKKSKKNERGKRSNLEDDDFFAGADE